MGLLDASAPRTGRRIGGQVFTQIVGAGLDDLGRLAWLVVLDDVPMHAGAPRSSEADAARKAVQETAEAAKATPVGQRLYEATADAQAARLQADQSPAAQRALGALETYQQAWRTRLATASATEQARMTAAMESCLSVRPGAP